MADPQFEQLFDTALYVLSSSGDDRGWAGFQLRSVLGNKPQHFSLKQSLDTFEGHYLFAEIAPRISSKTEVEQLIEIIQNFVTTQYSPNATVSLWIDDPEHLSFDLNRVGSYSFSYGFGLSSATLQSNFNHILSSELTLSIALGTPFSFSEANNALQVGSSEVATTQLRFITSPNDGYGPSIAPQRVRIPFTGSYRGCLLLAGAMNISNTLALFQTGLRYTYHDDSQLIAQIYPVIRNNSDMSISYTASFDPNDTVNEGPLVDLAAGILRTLFAMDPLHTPPLPSCFTTAVGHTLSLYPQGGADPSGAPRPGAGALVFERLQPAGSQMYLSFAGCFGLAVGEAVGPTATAELLCGLYGTETIVFRPYTPSGAFDVLCFTPHQNAYAPMFPYKSAQLDTMSANAPRPSLDSSYQTSWVSMRGIDEKTVSYCAQPAGSPLFSYSDTSLLDGESNALPVLNYHSTPKTLSRKPGFAFPLVPYAGVQAGATQTLANFESQIIGAVRKGIIRSESLPRLRLAKTQSTTAPSADAPCLATTPQGLLAELTSDADPHYLKVTLAQSPGGEMAFCALDAELQEAFQTNQLFLVGVDAQHFGSFANAITIEGWTMRAAIGEGVSATDYRNVFIMKFAEGTLLERVSSPHKWTDTADFSLSSPNIPPELALTGLSTWLQNYINQAITMVAAGNTLYENFVAIAQDPQWQGIIVLRASLDVDSLPVQLKGLAAGIDQTQFLAHHFGMYSSRVIVDGTALKLSGPSSLFGLVDYQLPAYQANVASNRPNFPVVLPTSGPYGFSVLQLQALFNNSKLIDFQSRVQLTLDQLFDSQVTSNFSAAGTLPINAIVLKGSYEHQGTTDTYVYETTALTLFKLNNPILQAVAIQRAQFNAQSAPTDLTTKLESRFLLTGILDFAVLAEQDQSPSDIFSFGSPPSTPPHLLGQGLAFSGLAINLSSPIATPNMLTFSFDAQNLSLDPSRSSARPKSLFSTFALQLRNIIQAPGDKQPADYGFLTTNVPSLALQRLSGSWYGIVYKLTMGTPGALVADAGFDSTLVTAWSAQNSQATPHPSAFVGLQLPGAAPGAKLFSIQGVLKLSVGSIDLLHLPITGHTEKAYSLRLNNIGLTFLGLAKIPPGATINFFLFGDPDGIGSLGWYAAYTQDQKKFQDHTPPLQLLKVEEGILV